MGRRCWSVTFVTQIGLLLLIVIHVNQAASSSANKTIHIGYLLSSMDRAGAINVAIEQARSEGLLRDYNFRYIVSRFQLLSKTTMI